MGKRNRSSIVIARMLGSEGFSSHTNAAVQKYQKHRRRSEAGRKRHYDKARKEFSELLKAKEFTSGERMILGRFLRFYAAEHLDTGLRIGLACRLNTEEAEAHDG